VGFRYRAAIWTNAFGDTTRWYYDTDGLLARVSYANGRSDTLTWDERHRINQLGDVSYTRGARGGRIDQMTVANPTDDRVVKYEYDFRNQLIEEWDSVAGQVPVTRTFAYDSAGNRTGAGYVHATGNRLLATPADTFAYDASGNLTWWKNKSTGHYKTFTWDAEGRLIRVKLYDSYSFNYRTVTFTYDGLGRRVKKLVTVHQLSETDTVRYVWNGRQVLAELDGSGTWTLRYTQHPTQVDRTIGVRTASGSSYFLHHDKVGNVVKVTDSSGTVVSQYRYDAFGKRTVVGTEGYASKRLWQGREYDAEAGLYYFRARYYALQIGRFIQEDPIGIAAELNLYRFGTNDPVNSTDPSGLCPPGCADSWATIGRAVGAAVGAVAGGVLVGSAGVGVCSPTGPAAVACGGEGAVIGSALLGATGMKVGEAVGRLGGSAVDAIHGAGLWSPPNWLTVVLELWNAIFVKEQTPQPPVIPDDGGPTTEQVEPPPGGGGGDGNDEDNGG
jgi:RHS repeat-associated protein